MTDRLFEPGPSETPDRDERREMSADRRRTARRAWLLKMGLHPTTKERLLEVPRGKTCAQCVHCFAGGSGRRAFWKCAKVEQTHGPGSDVRKSWPACRLFTEGPA